MRFGGDGFLGAAQDLALDRLDGRARHRLDHVALGDIGHGHFGIFLTHFFRDLRDRGYGDGGNGHRLDLNRCAARFIARLAGHGPDTRAGDAPLDGHDRGALDRLGHFAAADDVIGRLGHVLAGLDRLLRDVGDGDRRDRVTLDANRQAGFLIAHVFGHRFGGALRHAPLDRLDQGALDRLDHVALGDGGHVDFRLLHLGALFNALLDVFTALDGLDRFLRSLDIAHVRCAGDGNAGIARLRDQVVDFCL